MMNEIIPPMIKCNECVFSDTYYDNVLGKTRYYCTKMQEIGSFGDFYAITDSGCTEGIKMSADSTKLEYGHINRQRFVSEHLNYKTVCGRSQRGEEE